MLLYKYVSPARTDVLRDARIRYTQPMCFNDPFEVRPVYREAARLEELDRSLRILAQRWGWSDEKREQLFQFSEESYQHWIRPDSFDGPANVKATIEWMVEMESTDVGILSLTEKPDNLLMWAHYAVDHSGLCIGFDASHPHWSLAWDKDHAGVLRKVVYSNIRPNWGTLNMDRVGFFFTKSTEWEYEQEWRVFKNTSDADHLVATEPPMYLFDFPKAAVRALILGVRSTPDLENSVLEILGADEEYKDVEVYHAQLDDVEFKLRLVPIDRLS